MAAKKRDGYSDNEHSILYGETGGCCPLCTLPILFKKQGSTKPNKGYEVAHIYPLNPTPSQATALIGYPTPIDINALENVIALCPTCHTKYDKDFKLDELIKLRKIKDGYLSEARAKQTASQHTIQEEVYEILDAIASFDFDETSLSSTNFDVSTVDKKLRTGMSPLQKSEIKMYAISFYVRIRDHIRILEQQDQASVRILQNQINSYYLAMNKQNPENKDFVFNYVAQWISSKSNKPILAAKVLTSFFVQNCEVFDAGTE
ncbi:ABC-three component system protein [Methylotuvimicrobium buryatense]|uniref:HNH endonuclease n=1 Tax=Methylotuvimicrobium buryatense TaxID=95641 RepID=A0A4P9UQF1_METBY|nr:ABC-three component system protein [Methylotuvimicrobium buryatense]QCW83664.1 HNH endonuclease [Methylotuvimicrobium buryatense]